MSRHKDPDQFDWFGALKASTEQARTLRPEPKPTPAPCLCGSTDIRGRIIAEPVDLRGEADATCGLNEGQRSCRACQHGIAHGAMAVVRHYEHTNTVRDHYHPNCVRI